MDYNPPIILSGYEIPEDPVEQVYYEKDEPSLSVGYEITSDKLALEANLPVGQLSSNYDVNSSSLFLFSEDQVDFNTGVTIDVFDNNRFDIAIGGGISYIDEDLRGSLILDTSLNISEDHKIVANSFYNFDSVYTSAGYGYSF